MTILHIFLIKTMLFMKNICKNCTYTIGIIKIFLVYTNYLDNLDCLLNNLSNFQKT